MKTYVEIGIGGRSKKMVYRNEPNGMESIRRSAIVIDSTKCHANEYNLMHKSVDLLC